MRSTTTLSKLLILVLVVSMALGAPKSLGAQARLLDSTPSDGDSLGTIDNIRFEFDSLLISDAAASVTVTRSNGESIPVVDLSVDETVLSARVVDDVPMGTYEIGYAVRGTDGGLNEGILRVSVDAPSQALSGGLLAVIGIFAALFTVLFIVFFADKRRRP